MHNPIKRRRTRLQGSTSTQTVRAVVPPPPAAMPSPRLNAAHAEARKSGAEPGPLGLCEYCRKAPGYTCCWLPDPIGWHCCKSQAKF